MKGKGNKMADPMMMGQGSQAAAPEMEDQGEICTCPQCGYSGAEADFLQGGGMQGAGMQTQASPQSAPNTAQMVPPGAGAQPPDQDMMTAQSLNDRQPPVLRGNISKQASLLKAYGG
jgi:hypothetical protein